MSTTTIDQPMIVVPFVHTNGTSRAALLEHLERSYRALAEATQALKNGAPNARDYYPEPGRYELAREQHFRRLRTLADLQDELVAEGESIQRAGR